MSIRKTLFLGLIFASTLWLVYVPHLNYPFPLHIDEWHHVSEGLRMGNYGEYLDFLKVQDATRFHGLEIGFHFLLFLLSNLVNLLSVYQFLPALWAGVSGLTLFWVTYRKTNKNFWWAALAMIFFASLKSNVNILGLWFFTPLSFSLPFIFLFFYFFTEGVEKEDSRQILISLGIMVFLIPIHSLSVLFALPILLVYSLLNYKFILKKLALFSLFLAIPFVGILLYKSILNLPWGGLLDHLFNQLQFKYGWGVLEIANSPTELYSIVGYLLALIGAGALISTGQAKKYALYLLWPLLMLLSIIIYRTTGTSYFSPYQRNLYYFAISLPFLSAYGLYFTAGRLNHYLGLWLAGKHAVNKIKNLATISIDFHLEAWQIKLAQQLSVLAFFLIVLLFTFNSYYVGPPDFAVYHTINQDDYQMLNFLATLGPGKVMATPFMSTAVYPIAGKNPVATLAFYGDVKDIENFFLFTTCAEKADLIKRLDISYIISPAPLTCDYKILYAKEKNIIYDAKGHN